MRLPEILELTGAGKKTIYRWMDRHPDPTLPHEGSLIGRPFPRPIQKVGRAVEWDRDDVLGWWEANRETIGRHPETVVEMQWKAFRNAMLVPPEESPADDGGDPSIKDDFEMVLGFERVGEVARVRFRSASDALLFKLKY